jgi:hypothetical protein
MTGFEVCRGETTGFEVCRGETTAFGAVAAGRRRGLGGCGGELDGFVDLEGFDAVGEVGFGGVQG